MRARGCRPDAATCVALHVGVGQANRVIGVVLSRPDRRHTALTLMAMPQPIDVTQMLATISEPWSPRTVAVMNDYDIRVVKTHGEFAWHSHPETDELFLVVAGSLTIRLESDEVVLGPGQMYVVPKGVRHQPFSADGADVLLIEPSETVNTGDTPSHLTAERRVVTADAE